MFLENSIINFLMLWFSSHILSVRIKISYTILWSLLISFVSLIVELLTINMNTLSHHILYVAIYLFMTNLYFKRLNIKNYIHIIPAIILSTIIISGIFYTLLGSKTSILFFQPLLIFITLIILKFYQKLQIRNESLTNLYNISLCIKEKTVTLTGFLDTGNMLTDVYTGYPVIIIDYRIFKELLSKKEYESIEKYHRTGIFDYENANKTTRFYPLPYKTISSEISLMPALKVSLLNFTDFDYSTKKVVAGISRYKLNNNKDYQVLLNERIKPNREEKFK